MHWCGLCGREITDYGESLYCGFCHAIYHRSCIVDHFYYYRFCPICKREISFIDLQYGEPPHPGLKPPFPQKVRRPQWSRTEEVPFFGPEVPPQSVQRTEYVTPAPPVQRTAYAVRPRERGFFEQLKGFAYGLLPRGTWQRFRENKKGMLGISMLAVAVVIAVLAPYLIRYDPVVDLAEVEFVDHPPTREYLLGTDVFGRDIYSQVIWGFRSALMIAVPSALLVGFIGTVVGLASGYYGRAVDAVLERISMTFLVWPSVPLVALIVFSWGPYMALPAVILGVAFTLWPTTARAIRAEVLSLKNRPFIEAAKVSGASSRRIVFRHIFPSVIHITFLYMTIAVASALVLEATFNFLGLTSPAVVTWGSILSFTYHASRARFGVGGFITWWTILPPGLAIAFMVLSFFLISQGLRESMRISSMRL